VGLEQKNNKQAKYDKFSNQIKSIKMTCLLTFCLLQTIFLTLNRPNPYSLVFYRQQCSLMQTIMISSTVGALLCCWRGLYWNAKII